MSLDRLLSRLHLLSGLVITRSVLNPLLWLVAVVAPVSVVAAVATTGALRYLLLALAVVPVVAVLVAYGYFAKTAPGRLQSEEYQLKQHVLENLGDDEYTGSLLDQVSEGNRTRRQEALPPNEKGGDE